MILVEWGHSLESHIMFCILEMHCLQWEKSLSLTFFLNFKVFTEGSCEYVMNDHVLLNISTINSHGEMV